MRHILSLVFALIVLAAATSASAQETPIAAFNRGREAETQKDYATAIQNYKLACELGEASGCNNLGTFYGEGKVVARDRPRAFALYQRGCGFNSSALPCANLGLAYDNAWGVARDLPKALDAYAQSCHLPDAVRDICYNLGHYYYFGAFPDGTGFGGVKDKAKAMTYFNLACDLKSWDACHAAGLMYKTGDGVPQEPNKAEQRFELACYLSSALCLEPGLIYEARGRANKKNRKDNLGSALTAFGKACDRDVAQACYRYGLLDSELYKSKRGTWVRFEKACKGGIADGCLRLGDLYFNGEGVPKDKARAATEYEKACKGGSAVGCAKLPK